MPIERAKQAQEYERIVERARRAELLKFSQDGIAVIELPPESRADTPPPSPAPAAGDVPHPAA